MNAKQIWQSALERIQPKISQATFNTWFSGTSGVSLQGHVLTVGVKTTFGRAHLENRFHDLVYSVLSELIGADVQVCFEVGQPDERVEETLSDSLALSRAPLESDEVLEASLEEVSAQEPPPPLRHSALMAATAFRRNRLEVAQQGRRQPRRPLIYEGPELLPIVESSASVPLLAQITPPLEGRVAEDVSPIWEDEQRDGGQQMTTTTLGPSRPLTLISGGNNWEKDAINPAPPPAPAWDTLAPAQDSGNVENNGTNGLSSGSEGTLSSRYTFGTFVVGKSNRLAHAAAHAVADLPGRTYNPLVLYGGVGLGKTHLLHAIGHCGVAAGLNVLYTTADRFTNEIINAIRFHTTEEFRAKYRQIDVLLVDDIQFIAGKESTEEEFFHTFNSLHNANKQIVLTSDRPPKAIVTLQDRLRSRFEWGLLADIQAPEYEHRLAILRFKIESLFRAEGLVLEIPNEVIELIATPACASVRELEGTLNRLVAQVRLHHGPLTVNQAMQALQPMRPPSSSRTLLPAQVLEVVTRHYNLSLEALRGQQRDRDIVWPRQIAMFLMREETKANLSQIGAELGGRDHTTILHGTGRVQKELIRNERVRKELAALREELRLLAQQHEATGE